MADNVVTERKAVGEPKIDKIPDANKATGLRLNGMGDMVTFQYAKHHTDDAQLKEEARQAVVDAGHDKSIKDLQDTVNGLRSSLDTASSKITELTTKVHDLEALNLPKEYMSSWDFKKANAFPELANISDLNINGATLKIGDHIKTATSNNQYVVVNAVTPTKYSSDKVWHYPENGRPQ